MEGNELFEPSYAWGDGSSKNFCQIVLIITAYSFISKVNVGGAKEEMGEGSNIPALFFPFLPYLLQRLPGDYLQGFFI